MLQRKLVALGGVDILINFISMSVNDEVIASAAKALRSLEQGSKDACICVLHLGGVSALLCFSRAASRPPRAAARPGRRSAARRYQSVGCQRNPN